MAVISPRLHRFVLTLTLAASGAMVLAQDDPNAALGLSLGDSSGSYEVGGIEVDVTGASAEQARMAGWRLAQRKGWVTLSRRLGGGGAGLSDGTLDGMVAGIVVENEQIGPKRYVARLGVLFSRARAGSILGIAGQTLRSSPMLVLPLQYSGGGGTVFERKTDWAEAWTRYRTGNSAVDYVRPAGTGPDSLLLNMGQIGRPGRGWWRTILDQYGALDVLVPVVRLYRQWPGGPIIGVFEARHGPDDRLVTKFTLRVNTGEGLPQLLDAGVKRIDEAYQNALKSGGLNTDAGLAYVPPPPPSIVVEEKPVETTAIDPATAPPAIPNGIMIDVQFETPGAAAVSATEAMMRGIPKVRTALTSSLALGGVSVMRVGYEGDPATLQAALEARGWIVQGAGTALRIRRPMTLPIASSADNSTG